MDFPKHIRDCMLYLVMANRLGLVAEVSEVCFAPGADNQMLSMKLCGPTLGNDSPRVLFLLFTRLLDPLQKKLLKKVL